MSASQWPIVGHSHQVGRLKQMVARSSYPPAILITGVQGTGRLTLARTFAAAALCETRTDAVPCGTCLACRRIAAGTYPDVSEWSVARQDVETTISKSGTLTIETVRAISASTSLKPRESDRRFVIVDDADTLGDAAQQALLKTLEDVPSFVVMILISTSASAMLETVQSRCVEIPLQLVPTDEIVQTLTGANAERIGRLAAGRPGWAIRAVSDSASLQFEEEKVDAIEKWIAMPHRDRLIEAYLRGDRFLRQRAQVLDEVLAIRIAWRDLLHATTNTYTFAADPTRSERIAPGNRLTTADALRALKATEQCHLDLVRNVRPRLAMQSMVNKWPILS